MHVLPYYLAYTLPLTVLLGLGLGGWYTFLTPVVIFVVVPVLDMIIGCEEANPSQAEMAELEQKIGFRMVLYLYVPVQLGLIFWGANEIALQTLSITEILGLTLSIGLLSGGLGITIAHELAHKRSQLEKTLGKVLLLSVNYMHFYIEHNLGHHTHVATPSDPATARFGESFYRFWPRTVLGSWRSAREIECKRLNRLGLSEFSWRNQMLWFAILPLVFAGGLAYICGWRAIPFFFAQSLIAITLLEAVNYLEHYGLERRPARSGRFEQVQPAHSWNANHRITNYLLFKLQRHADHHIHPVRRYQALQHFNDSPQLPTGYAGMLLLTFIPPLWRRIMHPRLASFRHYLSGTTGQT